MGDGGGGAGGGGGGGGDIGGGGGDIGGGGGDIGGGGDFGGGGIGDAGTGGEGGNEGGITEREREIIEEDIAQEEAAAPSISPELIEAINEAAERFGAARFEGLRGRGGVPSLNPAIRQLLGFGTGRREDPRFEAQRAAQLSSLERGQRQQRASQSEFLSRRGIGQSSAAALNEARRLEESLAGQRQTTTAQLGMQEFGAQQAALAQGANLATTEQGLQLGGIQSRNLAQQANLAALAASIETLSLPDQLRIAEIAAKNAGTVTTSGGSRGGLFK
jgi:hypothetical protein